MNMVDSLKSFFGPETCTGIAQSLSESPETVQTAISAAVPTALLGLTNAAAQPEGARTVLNAVRETDTSILSRGRDLFTGTQAMSMMESGSRIVPSLFGGNVSDGIVSTISKFSGLPLGSAKSLVGMILPVILGFIGKSAGSEGANDPQSLAAFLRGQASSIAGAMPLGLKQHLSWLPGISSLTEAPVASRESWAPSTAVPQHAYTTGTQPSAVARYVPLLLLLIALGAIAWYLWPSTADRSVYNRPLVRQTPNAVDQTAQQASAKLGSTGQWFGDVSSLGDPTLGKDLSSTFSDLGTTLNDVRDSSSIDAAQRKLAEVQTRVDGWGSKLSSLPPETQTKVKEMLRSAMPAIQGAQAKAMSIPGAQEKLGPTLDRIMTKLRSYTEPAM